MIVEIVKGSDDIQEVRHRETHEIVALKQECYFHLPGSAYPTRGKVRVKQRYAPGIYQYKPEFKIGRFGDLEINPFADAELSPARPEQVKASA